MNAPTPAPGHRLGGFIASCLFSAVITLGLLALMRYFVSSDDAAYIEVPPVADLVFQHVEPDPAPPPRRKPPEPPKPPVPPPPAAPVSVDIGSDGPGVYVPAPPTIGDHEPTFADSRMPIPFLTPAPEYPRRAAARGIEGWVVVSFTITETGTVTDAVVVGSEPPGMFDSAALRTVARYKYHPQLVDGKPIPLPGMLLRIVFEMEAR